MTAEPTYTTVSLDDVLVGELLPVTVYLYIEFRFVVFRAEGHAIDKVAYDRLELRKIKQLFIQETDKSKWAVWVAKWRERMAPPKPAAGLDTGPLQKAREDVNRKMLDVFSSGHPDQAVATGLAASKKLVLEVMKVPYASQTLSHLQSYSRGTVDHSINVSILSTYLAMHMGYTSQTILQNIAAGGLLHDLGKSKVGASDADTPEQYEEKMKSHPAVGAKILEQVPRVPNEVVMIVAQHHENFDGTGFPEKLRGTKIYDLARIVSIANVFDELVGDAFGTLQERQRKAVTKLDQMYYKRFDPQKLDKALKILKLGI